jgi:hypothetical protein
MIDPIPRRDPPVKAAASAAYFPSATPRSGINRVSGQKTGRSAFR